MMTGISSTRPISKNIGSPISAPTSAIAHGSVAGLDRPTIVSTIWWAPPESASSLPNIAPSAIRLPTPAAVSPKPVLKLAVTSSRSSPATTPTTYDPMVSARKGCIFSQTISTTTTAIAATAARISCRVSDMRVLQTGDRGQEAGCSAADSAAQLT